MNRHVIITGGSSGIGKALAKQYAIKGDKVSLISRNRQNLQDAKEELTKVCDNADNIFISPADVTNQHEIEKAINTCIEAQGAITYLITSAGMIRPSAFIDAPISDLEYCMQINYLGTLYSIKAALPSMIAEKSGHIVLISSAAALCGVYGLSGYCPTKYALRGLAEVLLVELSVSNINVSIVFPPDTDTPLLDQELKERLPETDMILGTQRVLSAENVAKTTIKGVDRKKFEITPGLEITLLKKLNSMVLPFFRWHSLRTLRKNKT